MKKILFSVLAFTTVVGYSQNWHSAADIPVPIRAGNTASYSKNGEGFLFIVSGGDNNGNIPPKHQRCQISTDSWISLARPPNEIMGAATAILKDSLYVIGGLRTTPGSALRTVYKYSINENTWSQAANFPFALVDAKAVAYQDSLIYITGGSTNNTFETHSDECYLYDVRMTAGRRCLRSLLLG
ncbi:kelch repeat-containing protein [Flavobacterium noncentrifugens]|uniref:Kelch motif-containing protein n=1 Tax=Flavobacterium noncentrifugens TaxID=1128970 RepID=A0A1G8V4M4_9FLAO|nr:kelch repeat-containing protein [Flavobacterium noncentrifugens]SDJ60993.1 Kelch motif-containing protein [Flavobacterium noncentrifugens]